MRRPSTNQVVLGTAGLLAAAAVALFVSSPGAVASRERAAALRAASGATSDTPAVSAPPALSVSSLRIDADRVRSVARVSGVLAPVRSVTLSAQIDGAVTEVLAEEHGPVAAGAVLLRLDETVHRVAAERAEAGIVRALAAHRLAKLELERQQGLAKRSVGSPADLDRATNAERGAYAGLAEARAARADALDRLDKSRVRAPFAGVVNQLDLEPGAYVRTGDPVAEILDLSRVEIEVGVTDRQIVALHAGDPVEVRVDVFPDRHFEAVIHRVGKAAGATSQRYPVEIQLQNPEERLLPGMVADAIFQIGDDEPRIQIPRRATLREFELDYVFVLEPAGASFVARRRRVAVRPVAFRPQIVEIIDGLAVGDRIASSSIEQLRDGARVNSEE